MFSISLSAQGDCAADGGNLALAEGGSINIICAGDGISDAFTPVLTNASGENFGWIIASASGYILGRPANPPFDLEGAGRGVCFLYHISYDSGFTGKIAAGDNICELTEADGCFDLSNHITINRQTGDDCAASCTALSSEIALAGGSTSTTICVDEVGDPLDIVMSGEFEGDNTTFIITSTDGEILGIPPGAGPFDLNGAGPGTCVIWYLAYDDGLTGLTIGENTDDFDGCFDLSNGVIVQRTATDGGNITLADGSTETSICIDGIGDPLEVIRDGNASGANTTFVITDTNGMILGIPGNNGPFDLDPAGPGTCLIWHLAFEDGLLGAEVGMNANDLQGCFDLSNPITVVRTATDGGNITLADGSTETSICIDGIGDPLEVIRDGNASGANTTFVITDTNGMILGIPGNNGPFDLDPAGPGTCLIWYLAFEDGLLGAEVGMNANDLQGCFDLSNPITVVRTATDGGNITLADGSTETSICIDGIGDPLEVIRDGNASGANTTFVITDTNGMILGIPGNNGPFDLDPAGPGTCIIWYLAFEDGLLGAEVGMNANDLQGCFDLSNPITVVRTATDGGNITLADGSTETSICIDGIGDPLEVIRDGNASGANTTFVITDTNGMILGIPGNNGPFDLDPAGPGTCIIWYLAFEDGLLGAEVGMNANDLQGCFDLSNPITVVRTATDGGNITLADGSTETSICIDGIGDPLEVIRDGNASGANTTFVITDTNGMILGIPGNNGPFDLDPAGPGTCLIWYLAFEDGLLGAEVGMNANDLQGCFDLSNPITVVREECCLANGGNIYTDAANASNLVVVANRASATISVINADSNESLGDFAFPGGGQPMYVVHNPTNNTVLVGDYEGRVIAYDASSFEVTGEVAVGNGVFHMWMSNDRTQLWTSNELDRNISVVDPTTLENLGTVELPADLFDLGYRPHDVIFSSDNQSAFVTVLNTLEEDFVIRYDVATQTETHRVGVGLDPHVSLTSANELLYVAAQFSDELIVFNRADLSEVTRFDIPTAHGLGMNTNGTYLYIGNISGGGDSAIYTLDLTTNTLVGEPVDAPNTVPHNLAVLNGQLYLTHSSGANNVVSIYDLTPTPVLTGTVTVGSNPFGLAAFSSTTTTEITICIDNEADPIAITMDGMSSGPNSSFFITDAATGEILGVPGNNGPFDLNGAGTGTCQIWHVAYEDGLTGLAMGGNIVDIEGCFDLSNPITVTRNAADAGAIALDGGATEVSICTDGTPDPLTVVMSGEVAGDSSTFFITDAATGEILGIPGNNGPFDLDGAGEGVADIVAHHQSGYVAEGGEVLGNNISDIAGCFDLSNAITVTRNVGDNCMNGFNFTNVTINEVTPDGRIEFFNGTDQAIDVASFWLCNRPSYQMISALTLECGELVIQPGEITVVSGFSGFNAEDAELGLYINNSFGSSSSIISYLEWGSAGHGRASVAIAAGLWTEDFFLIPASGTESLQLTINQDNELEWETTAATICATNNATTSTETELKSVSLRVFPNPVNDVLNMEVGGMIGQESRVDIFNFNGRLVMSQSLKVPNGMTTINLPNIPAGAYILRVVNNGQVATQRFTRF